MAHYPQDPAVVCLRHSTQAAIVLRWLQDCLNAKMASHYPSNNPEIAQEMQMQIVHLNIKLKEALRGFLHCTVEGFEEFLQMGDEGHIAVIERARVLPAGPSSDC